MFKKAFRLAPLSMAAVAAYTVISHKIPTLLTTKINCLETIRANKPQLVQIMSNSSSEYIILVYNRESESQLRDEIIKIQDVCQQAQIGKIVLIDQTDVRHLQTFTKMVREEESNDEYQLEQVDLQGRIKIYYKHPENTGEPIKVSSVQQLTKQVHEIRNIIQTNPSQQTLKNSLKTFNRATITKNCHNQTCVDEYRNRIHKMIDLEMFKGKIDNYRFYVTNHKAEANIVSALFGGGEQHPEIYLHYNDVLGEQTVKYSEWLKNEGSNIQEPNRFWMFIKPRVHIISKASFYTDVLWYMSVLKNTQIPTFSINTLVSRNWREQFSNYGEAFDDLKLLKNLKEKFGDKLHLMILETPAISELFRHSTSPWRYTIFQLTSKVPYPKRNLSPLLYNSNAIPQELYERIQQFIESPKKSSEIIRLLGEKQLQINGQDLVKLVQNSQNSKKNGLQKQWILRMCGPKNDCQKQNAYEKYGLSLETKVYKLDSTCQNVGLDEGDYKFRNGSLQKLV